ncbi:MAG: hypothetical protein J7L66_00020, partial [Anaerolineaceae bacterium]|nr:hypothetical protein [Anaerolineaceae bacterium]
SPTVAPQPTNTSLPIPIQSTPTLPTGSANPSGPAPALPGESPDNATFIEDVTVPDGEVFWQNERFTKTWKIENTGTTTWDSSYKLVYVDGPIMGEDLIVSIINPVEPGNQVTLSVRMTAPNALGSYVNYWRMMNGDGQFFGDMLYMEILVGTTADKTPIPSG